MSFEIPVYTAWEHELTYILGKRSAPFGGSFCVRLGGRGVREDVWILDMIG